MTDQEKKIKALFYLETCSEPSSNEGLPKDEDCIMALVRAAHYLVQSMLYGHKPDNFDDVINLADAYIRLDEAQENVNLAQIRLGYDSPA